MDQSQHSQDSITQSFPLEAGEEGIRLKLDRARMTKFLLTFEEELLFRIRHWCMDIGTPEFNLNHFMSLENASICLPCTETSATLGLILHDSSALGD